jgi:hypothetical protein
MRIIAKQCIRNQEAVDMEDHLCGQVGSILAKDPEVPGSIPSPTRFSEK